MSLIERIAYRMAFAAENAERMGMSVADLRSHLEVLDEYRWKWGI